MKTNFTKTGFNHSVWAIIAVCLLFVSGNAWGLTTVWESEMVSSISGVTQTKLNGSDSWVTSQSLSWAPGYTNAYLVSGSNRGVTLEFDEALELKEGDIIRLYVGSTSSGRTFSLFFNDDNSATITHSLPQYTLCIFDYELTSDVTLSSFTMKSSGSNTYIFKVSILSDRPATGETTITYNFGFKSAHTDGTTSNAITTISGLSTTLVPCSLAIGTDNGVYRLTGQITGQPASESSSHYVDLQFTIADGYTFSPSSTSFKWAGNNKSLKAKVSIFDGSTTVNSSESQITNTSPSAANSKTFSFASGAFDDVSFTGTVHIRVYMWGVTGQRAYLVNPFSITGTVASAGGGATTYDVNIADMTNGSVSASPSAAEEDETVTLTVTPSTGYELASLIVTGDDSGDEVTVSNNEFTMPAEDVTVSATFSAARYTVTLDNQSATTAGTGSVTATYNASTNLTSAITCPTKTGYVFAGYFTDTNGTGVQLIDYAGNWIASAGGGNTYLDDFKNWKNAGALTLYACWMNYANSLDLQTYVEENVGSTAGDGTQSTDYSILSSNNYFYLLNTASKSTCLDNSDNAAYRGLKFKRSGDYVLFLVPANYSLSVKFGYVKTTKPKYSINGGAESSFSTISLASDNQSVDMGSETYDRLVKIKAADGDAAVLKTVTITSDGCTAFEFHYGTHDGSDWETACFEQVGETNEWQIEDFTIPSTPNYYVGYHGDGEGGWNSTWSSERAWTDWPTKSDNKWQGQIFLTPNDGALGSFAVGQATGATGTLTIHSDYNDYNKFLSFTPDGYGITYSGSGHAFAETATSNMYETDVVTLPNCTTTYNIGLKTATAGTYVKSIHSKTTDEALSAMGVTIKNGGKKMIYLVPGSFNSAGAVYAVWDCSYNSGAGQWGDGTTKLFTDVDEDGIYECPVDANCANIILVRLSSGTDASNISWDRKWNQTSGSSTISVGDLLQKYEITSLDEDNCSYSTTAMHPTTGEKGKFRMWANSASSNWYVHFIPYNVLSYDGNGGTGTTAQTERNTESSTTTVTVASNGFTAPTGYQFAGWATSQSHADAGTVDYAAGADYTLTSNATLYAVWTPATYTITLDKGDHGAADQSATVDYDATTVKSITHVTSTGYTLDGYYNGETKVLNADGTFAGSDITGYITSGKWSKADDCTLTAKWSVQTYTITYRDKDDEDFSGYHISGYPTTHTYGAGNTSLNKAVKQGYKFGGWYTASDCASGNKTVLNSTGHTENITLYAKWTEISFVGLSSGTFYGASAMVPDGVTVGSEQYYPGVSADQRFNLVGIGTSNADDGPMSSKGSISSVSLPNADAVTECMYFKKAATVTSYVPTDHAIQFKLGAAGQLEVWANNNIYLSNGSKEIEVTPSDNYAVVTDLALGTYYLYAKNTSRTLYGIRYKKTHTVTARTSPGQSTYGTVSASPTVVVEGSTSTITAVPATGYQVTNWEVSGSGSTISPDGGSNSTTTTLTMGTANATVTVTFGAIDYTITHSASSNGSYTIQVASEDPTGSSTTANYGQTITLAATPNDGYVLDNWTVTGATSGDAITVTSNQFTMPAEGVTVAATFVIPCTAVAAPTILTCSAQTPNTLTYTWTKASNASGYTATLYPDEDCEETPVSTQVLSDVATVTFTSLTASTTYYCKVQSNGDGSTYCENGGTTSAQSGTTTAPRIIYNANLDGTSGSTDAGTSTEGAKACGYSKSGYKFKWWNTAANGSGEDFYVGESVTLGGSDVNLYAQWEEVGSDEEFWVGDNFTFSDHVMSVGDMRVKENSVDMNKDITKDYNQVSKYSDTPKKAKVMAMDAADEYLEIYFSDGSAINELKLGTVHNGSSGTNKVVVIYSTTDDFSSGTHEEIEVSIPTCEQSSKSVTDFSPSTEDTYKYARIYRSVSSAVYSYTGPSSGGASKMRIYALKAKKGAATFTVTYADGGATSGSVPVDDNEYAEGDEVTVLGNTGSLAKTEHEFGGWSDGVTTYAAGDKFDMSASDVTLTAVWIINQYNVAVASVDHVTITATPAGGSAISEGNNANVDYGKSVTLAYSSLENGNYWGGWKVTKNLDGSDVTASVVDGNTLTVPAYAVTVSAVTYGDLVVWCDPQVTVSDGFCLTSYYLEATASTKNCVYTTSAAGNLLTINSTDLGGVDRIEFIYLDGSDNPVALTSSPFRMCNNGTEDYNVADPGTSATSWTKSSLSNTCALSYSIRYKPTDYDLMDNYKLKMVFKKGASEVRKTIIREMNGRSLPEEFVIAAKYNGQWYALPNTLKGTQAEQGAITPVKITVDNPSSTPTEATYAPDIAIYKGCAKYATANPSSMALTSTGSNYLQTSTSVNQMWLSSSGDDDDVDWYFKSTDRSVYTMTMDPVNNPSKKMGIDGGHMGYYATPTVSTIYLLPVENKYTDVPATATEWGQHSVVLAANPDAAATKAQARVEGGSPTEDQTISGINGAIGTAKNVKVPVGDIDLADLASNEGKLLYIDWYNSSSTLLGTSCVTIPRIIAADRNMYKDGETTKTPWNTEVHVLPGVTLTANTASYSPSGATIKELHIYPGATLNVSTGTLTATTLRLHNGWTRAGEKQYNTARVYINATNHAALAKGTASMDYDIYELTDGKHYYPLAVPFKTKVKEINYADTYLAGFSTYSTTGSNGQYAIKTYDGARRATSGEDQTNNWALVPEEKDAADVYLEPGKGYIITAVPVKGEAIIRVPLTFDNTWTADGEKETIDDSYYKNKVTVTAHAGAAATSNNRHAGWNMLGVPFMSCYGAGTNMYSGGDASLINGEIVVTPGDEDPYSYDNTTFPYVSVPSHDFAEYIQTDITDAELRPGWSFFVQVAESGDLTFAVSNQQDNDDGNPIYAPKRSAVDEVLRTGIILSGGEASDKTTILISNRYSSDYEINADLEKMFGSGYTLATYSLSGSTRLAYNAMSKNDATAVIPIGYRAPADGEYTFSINPRYAENGAFSRVDLIDYEAGTVTNLLYGSYTFESARTQNDTRFALNVVLKPTITTDVETISDEGLEMSGAHKMIIDDKLYIILDGKMYDATGKVVKGGQK